MARAPKLSRVASRQHEGLVEVGLVLEALQVPLVVLLEEGKSLLLGDVGPVGPQGDPVALEVWVVGAGGEHAGGAPHRGGARPPEGGPSSPHHHLHRLQVSVELTEHPPGDAVPPPLLAVLPVGRAVVVPRRLPREAVRPLLLRLLRSLLQQLS